MLKKAQAIDKQRPKTKTASTFGHRMSPPLSHFHPPYHPFIKGVTTRREQAGSRRTRVYLHIKGRKNPPPIHSPSPFQISDLPFLFLFCFLHPPLPARVVAVWCHLTRSIFLQSLGWLHRAIGGLMLHLWLIDSNKYAIRVALYVVVGLNFKN